MCKYSVEQLQRKASSSFVKNRLKTLPVHSNPWYLCVCIDYRHRASIMFHVPLLCHICMWTFRSLRFTIRYDFHVYCECFAHVPCFICIQFHRQSEALNLNEKNCRTLVMNGKLFCSFPACFGKRIALNWVRTAMCCPAQCMTECNFVDN